MTERNDNLFALAWHADERLADTMLEAALLLDRSVSDEVLGAWVLGVVTGLATVVPDVDRAVGHVDLPVVTQAPVGAQVRALLAAGALRTFNPILRAAAQRWVTG